MAALVSQVYVAAMGSCCYDHWLLLLPLPLLLLASSWGRQCAPVAALHLMLTLSLLL